MKKSAIATGAALVIGLASAYAEPLALNAAQMDAVTAGSGFDIAVTYVKLVDIEELITEVKVAAFDVQTTVTGWSAVAEGTSDCLGAACDSQTFTGTQIDPVFITDPTGAVQTWYKTASFSKSIALAN